MSVYSRKLLGIPTDLLEEIEIEPDLELGWKMLEKCGEKGDPYSNLLIARAYQTGIGLPPSVQIDWNKADKKYIHLIDQGTELGTPLYVLIQYRRRFL